MKEAGGIGAARLSSLTPRVGSADYRFSPSSGA